MEPKRITGGFVGRLNARCEPVRYTQLFRSATMELGSESVVHSMLLYEPTWNVHAMRLDERSCLRARKRLARCRNSGLGEFWWTSIRGLERIRRGGVRWITGASFAPVAAGTGDVSSSRNPLQYSNFRILLMILAGATRLRTLGSVLMGSIY